MIALALFTGASLSLGLQAERSQGISEPGVPVGVVLRAAPEGWRGEAAWSTVCRTRSPPAWATRATA